MAAHIEVIARGLVVQGRKVLLCRNLKHGYFYLPGGHVEHGEDSRSAVEREFLEEAGVRARAGRLVSTTEGVFERKGRLVHELNLVFHVELRARSRIRIKSREEKIGFEWLDSAAIHRADLRPRAGKRLVLTALQRRRPPLFLTDIPGVGDRE